MSDGKKDLTRIEDLGEFFHPEEDEMDSFSNPVEEEGPPDFSFPSDPESSPFEDTASTQDLTTSLSDSNDDSFPETESSSWDQGEADFSTTVPENNASTKFESSFSENLISKSSIDSFLSGTDSFKFPKESTGHPVLDSYLSQMVSDETYRSTKVDESSLRTQFDETSQNDDSVFSYREDSEASQSNEDSTQTNYQLESFSPKEDFKETKEFVDRAVLSDVAAECTPPFSVIVKNIRYLEDSDEILELLQDVGFPEDMLNQFRKQIERGTLLVPRISEFAAIYICHKLRHLKIDLTMGLSDILHPPKHSLDIDRGLVSKRSLSQNQSHKFNFRDDISDAKNIILSTLPHIEGHVIEKYLGVATEHTIIDSQIVENESSDIIHQSYDELAQKLKGHALQSKANAIVGINYQLTPIPSDTTMGYFRYKLTCTGNLVYLYKSNQHA
jgi:uncharacterized protein YbjQ (UPF0145 family)